MQIQTPVSGCPSATDCQKLRGNTSKASGHTCPLLDSFPNYQLLLATVGSRTPSWASAKHHLYLIRLAILMWGLAMTLPQSPCSGTKSPPQVLSLGHLQCEGGDLYRLRKLRRTGLGAQRDTRHLNRYRASSTKGEKLFVYLHSSSCFNLLKWTEVGVASPPQLPYPENQKSHNLPVLITPFKENS